jgi:hypothetical protein
MSARRGYIAMLDVLGTRGMSIARDPDKAMEGYLELRDFINQTLASFKVGTTVEDVPEGSKRPVVDVQTGIQFFSDAVIVSIEPEQTADPAATLCAISWLLERVFVRALKLGVLYRGAVSAGTFYIGPGLLIGPAVDEAAEWHDIADWAGIMFTPSAAMEIEKTIGAHATKEGFWHLAGIVHWDLPLKPGASRAKLAGPTWVIDWTYDSKNLAPVLYEAFTRSPVPLGVEAKKQNTLRFYFNFRDGHAEKGHLFIPQSALPIPALRDESEAKGEREQRGAGA